jgi:hypothetical protein
VNELNQAPQQIFAAHGLLSGALKPFCITKSAQEPTFAASELAPIRIGSHSTALGSQSLQLTGLFRENPTNLKVFLPRSGRSCERRIDGECLHAGMGYLSMRIEQASSPDLEVGFWPANQASRLTVPAPPNSRGRNMIRYITGNL